MVLCATVTHYCCCVQNIKHVCLSLYMSVCHVQVNCSIVGPTSVHRCGTMNVVVHVWGETMCRCACVCPWDIACVDWYSVASLISFCFVFCK